jgi:phage shock protein A
MESLGAELDRFKEECLEAKRRMEAAIEDSKRQRALYSRPASGALLAREQPPQDAWDGRLDRFERMLSETLNAVTVLQQDVTELKQDVTGLRQDVAGLQQDVAGLQGGVGLIREQMATKVELESLRASYDLVADGFADTQNKLTRVADLLKRYLVS